MCTWVTPRKVGWACSGEMISRHQNDAEPIESETRHCKSSMGILLHPISQQVINSTPVHCGKDVQNHITAGCKNTEEIIAIFFIFNLLQYFTQNKIQILKSIHL